MMPTVGDPTDRTTAARAAYSEIVAVRNVEVETHWTRYNIQIVLNSTILFGFLAVTLPSDLTGPTACLGSALTPIWLLVNVRGHM